MKRTTLRERVVPAVLGQVGAGEDADRRADERSPARVMIRLPTIALSRPPAQPGGGVICVKTLERQAGKPFVQQRRTGSAPARPGRTRSRRQRQRRGDGVGDGARRA